MYFDSHAHYDDERFDEDREMVLKGLPKKGVDYVMNVGADLEGSKASVRLADQYEYIYAAVGVHPHEAETFNLESIEVLKELAQNKKVKAIGEIGLDYYYDYSPRALQVEVFKQQIALAKKLKLPIIVHSRDACQMTFDTIKESGANEGVIHCFSGSKELAKEYIKLGFYIGVGGSLTFKNAKKTVEVVEEIPIENILIETDCPYLTPVPHRGKRNDSSYLVHVVEKIAEIKGISVERVAQQTKENAKKLYNISK